jgi:hypothetical protein
MGVHCSAGGAGQTHAGLGNVWALAALSIAKRANATTMPPVTRDVLFMIGVLLFFPRRINHRGCNRFQLSRMLRRNGVRHAGLFTGLRG